MMQIEPSKVIFRDVKLYHSYTSSISITNTSNTTVDFSLRSNHSRYQLSLSQVHLVPGQSVVVSIRLYMSSYPKDYKDFKEHIDIIHLSSSFFHQKIEIVLNFHQKKQTERNSQFQDTSIISSQDNILELKSIIQQKDVKIEKLTSIIENLEQEYPDFQKILNDHIELERSIFEEKSQKALTMLYAKDEIINELRNSQIKLNESFNKEISEKNEQQKINIKESNLNRENEELREKIGDQAEQIEVLISEIARLRKDNDIVNVDFDYERLLQQNEINSQLLEELNKYKTRCEELEKFFQNEAEEKKDTSLNNIIFDNNSNNKGDTNSDNDDSNHKNNKEILNDENLDKLTYKDNILIRRLQERAQLAEEESNKWRMVHEADNQRERNLIEWETHLGELESKINIKLNELELRTNELNRRDEVLNQRLESINELSNGIDINKISSNVDSVSQQSEQVKQQSQLLKANFDNENAWWIYVWHQIQKKTYDSEEFKIDQSQINLKEYHATALHNQAMEIANLRQSNILEAMNHNNIKKHQEEEIENLRREVDRLKLYIKSHRQDRETKILELTRTIQILSTKSDLHNELAQTKQDLHLEKLLVENLRRDIETYQTMFKVEQLKSEKLKKELVEYQSLHLTSKVMESIESIPGVNPLKLIEVFSIKIKLLEDEIITLQSKSKNIKENCEKSSDLLIIDEIHNSLLNKTNDDYLNSLDTALLTKKVLELENLLKEKRSIIQELTQEITIYKEEEKFNKNKNIDTNYDSKSTEKLLILHQTSLNQAKEEISTLKYQLDHYKEKETAYKHQILHLSNNTICLTCQKSIKNLQETEFNNNHNHNHNQIENYESEIENLKSLVRERTSQLKVLMETLDTLQSNQSTFFPTEYVEEIDNHDHNSSIYNSNNSKWELHGLIKRIIELTTELAVQYASNEMSNRKIQTLDNEIITSSKKIKEYELKELRYQDGLNRLQIQISSLIEQLNNVEKSYQQDTFSFQSRIDELTSILKEKEFALNETTIYLEEYKKQVDVTDQKSFQQWFEMLIHSSDTSFINSQQNQTKQIESKTQSQSQIQSQIPNVNNDVRELVVKLLVQWRDQVGFYPRGASGPISKAEEKFLKHITDLVMESYEKVSISEEKIQLFQSKFLQIENNLKIRTQQLETVMIQLQRYHSKSLAYEQVVKYSIYEKLKLSGSTSAIYINAVNDLMLKIGSITEALIFEKSKSKKLELELKKIVENNKINNDRISKSNNFEMFISNENIKTSETILKKWFKTELPRLLTGLPISEDDSENITFDGITPRRISSLGLDETYALSQTICALKISQHTLQLQNNELEQEKLYLRKKIAELESELEHQQILKFHEKISTTETKLPSLSTITTTTITEGIINDFQTYLDTPKLQKENIELKEQIVKYETHFEFVKNREKSLMDLIENLRENESKIQMEMFEQMKQHQLTIEDKYLNDIKDLSETFEMEKIQLHHELDHLTESYLQLQQTFTKIHQNEANDKVLINSSTQTILLQEHLQHQNPQLSVELNIKEKEEEEEEKEKEEEYQLQSNFQSNNYFDNLNHVTNNNNNNSNNSNRNDNDNDNESNLKSEPECESESIVIQELRYLLDLEKHKSQLAEDQIHELENMLETQRLTFSSLLAREREAMGNELEKTLQLNQNISIHDNLNLSNEVFESKILLTNINQLSNDCNDLINYIQTNFQKLLHSSSSSSSSSSSPLLLLLSRDIQKLLELLQKFKISLDNSSVKITNFSVPKNYSSDDQEDQIPDWYMSVLKQLRERISILEETLSKYQIQIQNENNDSEKIFQNTRRSFEDNRLNEMKQKYEEALIDAQNALEEQTRMAKIQIENLETLIKTERTIQESNSIKSYLPNSILNNNYNNNNYNNNSSSNNRNNEEVESNQIILEYLREIEEYKNKLMNQEKNHADELQSVWSHFQKYRTAQELLTNSLEDEVRKLEKSVINLINSPTSEATINELTSLCEIKRNSLKSVLQALTIVGGNTSTEGDNHSNSGSFLREELLEARLVSSEKEINDLKRKLNELKNSKVEIEQNIKLSKNQQRGNNLNNNSNQGNVSGIASENHELKGIIRSNQVEISNLQQIIDEQKNQIQTLREENIKKSRLLTTLKTNKSAEVMSLEQWKHEYQESEEKLRRATRSISNKDVIIKDLKTKISQLESKLQEFTPLDSSEIDNGDLTTMSLNELKRRLKLSEQEKSRMKTRLSSYREKIIEIEKQNSSLKEENTELKKHLESSDSIRLTLSRKDSIIKSQKELIEKNREQNQIFQEESLNQKNELEKQIRSLQRQLDIVQKKCIELQELNAKLLLSNQQQSSNQKNNKPERNFYAPGLDSRITNEIQEIMSELSETGGDYKEQFLSNIKSNNNNNNNVNTMNINNSQKKESKVSNNISSSSSISTSASDVSDITSIEERLKTLVNLNLNTSNKKKT